MRSLRVTLGFLGWAASCWDTNCACSSGIIGESQSASITHGESRGRLLSIVPKPHKRAAIQEMLRDQTIAMIEVLLRKIDGADIDSRIVCRLLCFLLCSLSYPRCRQWGCARRPRRAACDSHIGHRQLAMHESARCDSSYELNSPIVDQW